MPEPNAPAPEPTKIRCPSCNGPCAVTKVDVGGVRTLHCARCGLDFRLLED
jgi:transcription elongation factor Elf1